MIQNTLHQAEGKMQKSLQSLEKDLAAIRTGRASANLVDHVIVDYYGTQTPLNQLAAITVPDAKTIAIQAWDKSATPAIEKAILKSELGLTPANDGNLIRLRIPTLTEDRRRDLAKVVHKRVEEARIAIRNVRRDAIEELRAVEKKKEISQDDLKRAETQIQKATDAFIARADKIGQTKEAELMEV